ncbi:MAG TPA: hypothetical protein VGK74_02495 [Symbiobacteriaceae bacterium]
MTHLPTSPETRAALEGIGFHLLTSRSTYIEHWCFGTTATGFRLLNEAAPIVDVNSDMALIAKAATVLGLIQPPEGTVTISKPDMDALEQHTEWIQQTAEVKERCARSGLVPNQVEAWQGVKLAAWTIMDMFRRPKEETPPPPPTGETKE